MGYLLNVSLSVPMGVIVYLLTEKLILGAIAERNFEEKVQSNFIIGFIVGLAYVALAMSAFAEKGIFDNQSMQLAMYGAGIFLVLNSVFFSWDVLDENTKILILTIAISGLVLWSYSLKRYVPSDKKNKKIQ